MGRQEYLAADLVDDSQNNTQKMIEGFCLRSKRKSKICKPQGNKKNRRDSCSVVDCQGLEPWTLRLREKNNRFLLDTFCVISSPTMP